MRSFVHVMHCSAWSHLWVKAEKSSPWAILSRGFAISGEGIVSTDAPEIAPKEKVTAFQVRGTSIVYDSMGKPNTGSLHGNTHWMGTYDECQAINYRIWEYGREPRDVQGTYCTVQLNTSMSQFSTPLVRIPAMPDYMGLCVPKTCSAGDLMAFIGNDSLADLGIWFLPIHATNAWCSETPNISSDSRAIACICVLAVFAVLVFTATILHGLGYLHHKHKEATLSDGANANDNSEDSWDNNPPNYMVNRGFEPSMSTSTTSSATSINLDSPHIVTNKSSEGTFLPAYDYTPKFNSPNDSKIQANFTELRRRAGEEKKVTFGLDDPCLKGGVPGFEGTNDEVTEEETVPKEHIRLKWRELRFIGQSVEDPKPEKSTIWHRLLLMFSMYNNIPKLLDTTHPPERIKVLNAMRFFSLCWIILGNTFNLGTASSYIITTSNLKTKTPEFRETFTHQAVLNAFFAVDTFFVVGGVSIVYLFLSTMKHFDCEITPTMMLHLLFQRFWRLIPLYMSVIMVFTCLQPYFGDGPVYPMETTELSYCEKHWWTNLLFINNIVHDREPCLVHTWYLSADMQFFIISSIILIILIKWPKVAYITIALLFCVNCTVTAIEAFRIRSSPTLQNDHAEYWNSMFTKPWCRIGPYLIGILLGVLLYETEGRLPFYNWKRWIFVTCGWAISLTCISAVVYGIYAENRQGGAPWSVGVYVLYETTKHYVFALAVAWIIFACASGNGGFVNHILCWDTFIPLCRLTYASYLVHPIIIYRAMYVTRAPIHVNYSSMAYFYIGHVALSYATSLLLNTFLGTPLLGLKIEIMKYISNLKKPKADDEQSKSQNHFESRLAFTTLRKMSVENSIKTARKNSSKLEISTVQSDVKNTWNVSGKDNETNIVSYEQTHSQLSKPIVNGIGLGRDHVTML
ncbi:unnamed protein product [Owenia fusiformis]|uniref:Nose resistant-to-fluoxetine protein N-terminal domain-containing protein n=1 Tax=Owenia fusiformis TaxID=6347 RepID=A0A8S4PUI1_OWEFU|nr:unnamed protein product [Owenia fusiformis]